jgi:hypothetical protein
MKIGIVGRQLSHSKWEALFDILDQGKEAEVWTYTKYSLDNGKTYNGSEDDCLIFLATSPKCEDGKEYIQFTTSANDSEITSVMQEFANRIMTNIPEGEVQDALAIDDQDAEFKLGEFSNEDNTLDDFINCDIVTPVTVDIIQEKELEVNLTVLCDEHKKHEIKRFDGIVIEINGKDVLLHKDDTDKVCQLMEFCKEHGYKIKDVVLCN